MADLGKRYKCYKCGTKFYDLNKSHPICPSCGEDQNIEENKKMLKRKKRRVLSKVKSDIRPMPDEVEAVNEPEEEVEEYVLDVEDIVLEENADTNPEEEE